MGFLHPVKLEIDTDVSTVSAVNAGNYPIGFRPIEPNTWDNGSTDTLVTTWSIDRATPRIVAIHTSLYINQTKTVFTTTTTGSAIVAITATTSNSDVAVATVLTSNTVSVKGLSSGTAVIYVTVQCLQTDTSVNISIRVAETENYSSGTCTCNLSITKVPGKVTLSAVSGTVVYDSTITFNVTENLSGGNLTVASANNNYVKAEIIGSTVTVTPVKVSTGAYDISVKSAAYGLCTSTVATFPVVVTIATPTPLTIPVDKVFLYEGHSSTSVVVSTTGDGALSAFTDNPSACRVSVSNKTIYIYRTIRGTATITVRLDAGTNYLAASEPLTFNVTAEKDVGLIATSTYVSYADWQSIIQEGRAAETFKVGDYFNFKTVSTTTTLDSGSITTSTYRAVCIGIDHNPEYEGRKRVHFAICRNTSDKELAFYAMKFNSSAINTGGWADSVLRSWLNSTFYSKLPSDLRSVISPCTKYTDNVGDGTNLADNVTATSNPIFLLSEYEIFGSRTYANEHEHLKQAQYEYFKLNNPIRYRHSSTSTATKWWTRSPNSNDGMSFVSVDTTGAVSTDTANTLVAFVPCFTIG